MKHSKIILTAILLLLSTALYAQQPNFSGTWVQTQKTSLSGKNYSNSIPSKVNISQTADQFIIKETSVTGKPGQDTTITVNLTIDGKPNIKTGKSKRASSVMAAFNAGHTGFKEPPKSALQTSPIKRTSRSPKTGHYHRMEKPSLSAKPLPIF
jgi:hypothetical protein